MITGSTSLLVSNVKAKIHDTIVECCSYQKPAEIRNCKKNIDGRFQAFWISLELTTGGLLSLTTLL